MRATKMYAPWCVGEPNEADRTIGIRDDADFVIAEMCDDTAYSDADMKERARLIAAAPMLLAVVQELEESASYWSEYDVPLGIVDRLRAAIAAATRETK